MWLRVQWLRSIFKEQMNSELIVPVWPTAAERMEKEAEEERVRKQKASAERAFQEGIAKNRLVMRHTPLGMDRNHNR